MQRWMSMATLLALPLLMAAPAFAQQDRARVRVVHASPDAPAVDVLVDGAPTFRGIGFKGITDYAVLGVGSYGVKVVPAGVIQPAVIDTSLPLSANVDHTVIALDRLASIESRVLIDDNRPMAAGKARVRFVHAAPDAPAVDVAVAEDGPVLFRNTSFRAASTYAEVDAGLYSLEVRIAGTRTVALKVPALLLDEGNVYTIYAMGLLKGIPSLQAIASLDARPGTIVTTKPKREDEVSRRALMILGASIGLVVVIGSILMRRRRPVTKEITKEITKGIKKER